MSDNNLLWTPVEKMIVDDTWRASAKRKTGDTLDKEAFLQLLITQMKYQDPLNPMEDKEFIGQMAQFSALEQMQNLNQAYSKSQAYSMIGKTVEAGFINPATGEYEEVYGFVDAVTTKGSSVYLVVDGKEVPLDAISIVEDAYLTSLQLNSILNMLKDTTNQSYVGKYIQAFTFDDDRNVTGYIEGVVDYVKMVAGNPVLMVGDNAVYPDEVYSISNDPNNHPFLYGKKVMTDSGEMATIVGVDITAGNASLVLSNGAANISISTINSVMESLYYVGQNITIFNDTGKVEYISFKNGVPVFNINTEEGMKQRTYNELLDFKGK